jgi:hypothetical protein
MSNRANCTSATHDAPGSLPTVLLRHETAGGVHHDWLMADPRKSADPESRLWTGRVGPPSRDWADLGTWPVQPIGAHRRDYLTYEGPLSGGRGRVTRVDEGTFVPLDWTKTRILIDLKFRHCQGRVELVPIDQGLWRATLSASEQA